MEVEGILYETLSPLSATTTSTTTEHPPPSSSDEHEPYLVFRNEISLSTIQCPSPETAAVDYFSLDLDGDAAELNNGSVSTPASAAGTPLPVKETARGLEGNWFRANCRFKSPMLQLHKGIATSFLVLAILFSVIFFRFSSSHFPLIVSLISGCD